MSSPIFAVRGTGGMMVADVDNADKTKVYLRVDNASSTQFVRVMKFSSDGNYFAYCDGVSVTLMESTSQKVLLTADLPRTTHIIFSPKSSVMCTFEPYALRNNETKPVPNVHLYSVATGELLTEFIQKKLQTWEPQWSDEEAICCRIFGSEIHFYENNSFERFVHKLTVPNVATYMLSHGTSAYHICTYVPEVKSAPCFIRLYLYPNFGGANASVAAKSFFKADRVAMKWNCKGSACLVVAQSDVDKSGGSYYGEQMLFLLLTKGEGLRIMLGKDGPIYSSAFNPKGGQEFCVIYGYMPAKATLYNLRGDPTFEFGTGPRNEVHYSPFGNMVILAGFGNLRGNIEVWCIQDEVRKVVQFSAEDCTYFSWAPDGEHLAAATTAPRLRVSNGYRLLHYTGNLVHQRIVPDKTELWEFAWQPAAENHYECRGIVFPKSQPSSTTASGAPAAKAAGGGGGGGSAYVPPHLRGQSGAGVRAKFNIRDEDEKPQNVLQAGGHGKSDANLSKAALKNKKKREAKKATGVDAPVSPNGNPHSPHLNNSAAHGDQSLLTGDADRDKKIKNLSRKLEQIKQLKQQQSEGKVLESNQIDKLKKEQELLDEIEALKLS